MNLPVQTSTLDPERAYRQRQRLRIPCTSDVEAAGQLLTRRRPAQPLSRFGHRETLQSVRSYEAPRWQLTVSPGVITVSRKLTAPMEHFGHTDGVQTLEARPTRGRVSEWSWASRNRMTRTLESLDYGPMFADAHPAAMVTLTLPGDGWDQLVPDLATFKRMVDTFVRGYTYAWGEQLRGTWKMEFQERGAPHLHILMVPPAGLSRGRGARAGLPFRAWLSLRWTQIVHAQGADFKPTATDSSWNHWRAGTNVNYSEVARYSDPRRIGAYFAKHGSFGAKEYQNEMPPSWRDAILAGETGGANFWGYWGLSKAEVTVPLLETDIMTIGSDPHDRPPRDAVVVMRHLRKLARSRSFVRTVETTRWSVDAATGEVKVRTRHSRRRHAYLRGRQHGYLSVNDGPATAADIARLLWNVEGPGRGARARYQLTA